MSEPQPVGNVANWTFDQKLLETLRRAKPKILPEAWQQIEAILTPEAIAIVAAVLVAWVVSHAFGVGAAIDIIIAVVGVVAIGLAVFAGLDHLYEFAAGAYTARTAAELDAAAEHFAEAVAILGIQAVLAVLFRGAPRTFKGAKVPVGPPPPRTPGLRYKPSIGYTGIRVGRGSTSAWGDIVVSSRGTATERAVVLLHEKVHRFLTPKLYLLRNFRVQQRFDSYFKSSLSRYLEEALCETVAQVGVLGIRNFFEGIRFPVSNGYVHLISRGGYSPAMQGKGVLVEGAGLIAAGLLAHGLLFDAWFSPLAPAAVPAPSAAKPVPPFLPVPR